MNSIFRARCASGAFALAASLFGASAFAQGLPLDKFDPAPAGDRFFGVPSPFVAGHLTPHAGVLLDYAHNPLVIRSLSDNKNVGSVVSSQLFLHVNAAFALWDRLQINLDLPIALLQRGDSPTAGGAAFPSPDKAQLGDLRAGLRVRIFGDYHDAFQLGVGGYVYIPTGAKDAFVGTGKVRGQAHLLLGGRAADRVVWSLAAGPQISGTQSFAGVTQGTAINVGAGVGVLLGESRHLQIGPEAYASFTVAKDDKSAQDALKRATNLEVLLDARYRVIDDLEISLGAGPGLTAGLGTPDFRGVFMIAYTPEQKKLVPPSDRDGDGITDDVDACPDVKGVPSEDPKKHGCPPPSDRDGDGITDDVDACPDVKGVPNEDPKKHGCPPPSDRDGDGIIDDLDACPDVKGVPSEDPKKNGCPPDRDGDGIYDDVDACPDVKGVPSEDPKKNGCPPDTDGDGIIDPEDACPNDPGPKDPDPKKNGCPTVRVTEQEIIILEQVQFDTGKATIKKVSDELLDKVAKIFREHPEILKVEVQGHTDNQGLPAFNKKLSNDRADAVLKALVKRGIAKTRLVAKGYGQDKPIADNGTDAGRQENRRVQFVILDKRPKTAADAPPPPPPDAAKPKAAAPKAPATKPAAPKKK
jgi:outer membrane protein OmpA-like peptidoglycan-associated protein